VWQSCAVIRSGLLDDTRRVPLADFETYLARRRAAEVSIANHNIVLLLQAMGWGLVLFGHQPRQHAGRHLPPTASQALASDLRTARIGRGLIPLV